jgi:hypothetical protein
MMMKRHSIWIFTLGLIAGCSYYYGKGGIVDQAVLEDIAQSSGRAGKTSCEEDKVKAVCRTDYSEDCQALCDSYLRAKFQK